MIAGAVALPLQLFWLLVSVKPPGIVSFGTPIPQPWPAGQEQPRSPNGQNFFVYCFLTWILPLKERSRTEEDPALAVPANDFPWVVGTELCAAGCRGKSLLTAPWAEVAVISTEAFAGKLTSMSPEWLARTYSPLSPKSPL